MMILVKSSFVLLFLAAGVVACSSSNNSGSSVSAPTKACTDTADAVAKAAARCGSAYQASYDAFVNGIGGCGNIVSIRDEASLRCFSSLSTISCTDFAAGNLDASCKGQLLKAHSFEPPVAPVDVPNVAEKAWSEMFLDR